MKQRVRLTGKQTSLTPEGLEKRRASIGLSLRDLAVLVGRSHVHVYNVLHGRATSAPLLSDIDRAIRKEENKSKRRGSK